MKAKPTWSHGRDGGRDGRTRPGALRSFAHWAAVLGLSLSVGCGTLTKKMERSSEPTSPSVVMGPPAPTVPSPAPALPKAETGETVAPLGPGSVGPIPSQAAGSSLAPQKVPKLGLILGPGGLKAYAHVGVLRAFEQHRIPIEAIVGLEWGALVAGYFAQSGHVNDAEWSMLKLREDDVPLWSGAGFFKRGRDLTPVHHLDRFLNSSVRVAGLEAMKIPYSCPTVALNAGRITWLKKGSFREAMYQCLPYPPLFGPADGDRIAAAGAVYEASLELKRQGAEVIVFVNLLDRGPDFSSEQKKQEALLPVLYYELGRRLAEARSFVSEVITVPTHPQSVDGFEGRRDLMLKGEKAAGEAAKRLSKKYGF